MSTQRPPGPGLPRRRRIAGERRPRPLPGDDTSGAEPAPATRGTGTAVGVSDDPAAPYLYEEGPAGDSAVEALAEDRRPRRTGWWGSRTSLLILGVLLAVLLTLLGLLALGLLGTDSVSEVNEAQNVDRTMRTAPAAAEAAAAAILAYDSRSLEADADTAVRFMTDDFAQQYSDTFEKVVRPAAEQNRARVEARVLGSGVVRATEDTARVLLFVDQTTVSKANKQPQVALNRVEMSMVRQGDAWLVDDISSY